MATGGARTGGARSDQRGFLDTSVFIAREAGRPLGELPDAAAISVITLAELHLGVLIAQGAAVRTRRLRTLLAVQNAFEPLPIDSEVARNFAEFVAEARREAGEDHGRLDSGYRRHDLPVYTRDEDFSAIPKVQVRRI